MPRRLIVDRGDGRRLIQSLDDDDEIAWWAVERIVSVCPPDAEWIVEVDAPPGDPVPPPA